MAVSARIVELPRARNITVFQYYQYVQDIPGEVDRTSSQHIGICVGLLVPPIPANDQKRIGKDLSV